MDTRARASHRVITSTLKKPFSKDDLDVPAKEDVKPLLRRTKSVAHIEVKNFSHSQSPSGRRRLEPGIHESKAFSDVLCATTFNTKHLFDCDNTLQRPRDAKDVGSDQWFNVVYEASHIIIKDGEEARIKVLNLNAEVQTHTSVKPVEHNTMHIIKRLQGLGFYPIIITSRGPQLINQTMQQLKEIGFPIPEEEETPMGLPTKIEGRNPVYYKRVIFCDGTSKRACAREYFKLKQENPKHAVMADDSRGHLVDVNELMVELKGEFVGIHYTHLKSRVTQFKMDLAAKKFAQLISKFSPIGQQTVRQLSIPLGLEEDKKEVDITVRLKSI